MRIRRRHTTDEHGDPLELQLSRERVQQEDHARWIAPLAAADRRDPPLTPMDSRNGPVTHVRMPR